MDTGTHVEGRRRLYGINLVDHEHGSDGQTMQAMLLGEYVLEPTGNHSVPFLDARVHAGE